MPIGRLAWIAIGTFAIGTEAFMLAGLLPHIAGDLGVSLSSAAYIITVYAALYAVGAPVLATLAGGVNRKTLLVGSIATFAVSSFAAAHATAYWALFAVRIVSAVASVLFTPTAYALAGTAVERSLQGRALALVAGGFSASLALGAPLATLIAEYADWRVAFMLVSALCVVALIGIQLGIDRPPNQPSIDLRTRLQPIRDPQILLALLQFTMWLTGSFGVYFFLAPMLEGLVQADGTTVSVALLVFGVAGVAGTIFGGYMVDAWGPKKPLVPGLLVVAAIPFFFSALARTAEAAAALVPALVAIAVWGFALWSLSSVQQVRLLKLAPTSANVVLSLNASATYVGMALGASLGAATLRMGSAADIGWVGGACIVIAILLIRFPVGRATRRTEGE